MLASNLIKYSEVEPVTLPVLIIKSNCGVFDMLTYFLGIDPSATSTGVTLLGSDGSCETLNIKPKKLRDCARLQYIATELNNFIQDKTIKLCVYESPSYGSTHKEFILGEALGVIKLTVTNLSIPMLPAAPTQLKKYLCGSGSASKKAMISKALELGCPSKQEDICDSYSAALLAKDVLIGPLRMTRSSLEVRKLLCEKLG